MHDVKALIALKKPLEVVAARFTSAVVCPLVQGLALLPITDAFTQELADAHPELVHVSPPLLESMAPGVAALAAQLSEEGPVAFISTEFFGGTGGQDALVWKGSGIVFALSDNEDNMLAWPNTPISQALRAIGVQADDGKDEFDTVGLGTHRSTKGWANAHAST
ncbi:hypothetical protein [Variovorax soli]|uniref:Uncharacterized protein n=1 Tax=Variovorax soli TaxID=376815 RepID=A0ABU1N7P6_9BURK|nr:hypothetical protein [Variovorax soli]MDR6534473.1 hypothetical protein [Variovorax soli]